jgi:hypothetical protein
MNRSDLVARQCGTSMASSDPTHNRKARAARARFRSRTSARSACLVAVAVVAVVIATPSAAHPAKRVADSATFADPVDNGGNPDITQLTVSNDNAGVLTIAIAISNRSEFAADEFASVFLDTDSDTRTGDLNGMDYGFSMGSAAGPGIAARWTGAGTGFGGSGWTTIVGSRTFVASWAGGPRFTISQSELGNTPRISFYAIAGRVNTPPQDDAPDNGLWEYELDIPLLFKSFALVPKVPRAGKELMAKLLVRTNTSEPQPVRCLGRLGSKTLRGRGGWLSIESTESPIREAELTCFWKIPRTAKGKRFSGSISATNDGVTVTRTFLSRVR